MRKISVCVVVSALLLSASLALGQASTGNIYGRVMDEQGGVLPGVSVTASGPGAPQTTFSDPKGEFHFLNLSVGSYKVTSALQGFSTVERNNVVVNLGQNTDLSITMKLSSVSATVTVTGEVPLIDPRKNVTGANYQLPELKSIPTGRDPWVVIQQVPGVQIDRLNVAGSQSGQQSNYIGMGTDTTPELLQRGRRHHHRHGRARLLAHLLRLRPVPGDPGGDGRRGPGDRRAGRDVEHGHQARLQRAARLRALLLLARRAAGQQRARGGQAAGGPGTLRPRGQRDQPEREGGPHLHRRLPGRGRRNPGLRRRGGRLALEGQGVALGQLRTQGDPADEARRNDGHDVPRRLRREAEPPADRIQQRDGLLLPRGQAEARPVGRRHAPAGDLGGPDRPDDDLEGRGLPRVRPGLHRRRVVRLHALGLQPAPRRRAPDADDQRVSGSQPRLSPLLHR